MQEKMRELHIALKDLLNKNSLSKPKQSFRDSRRGHESHLRVHHETTPSINKKNSVLKKEKQQ
jgi:hypothetical protein